MADWLPDPGKPCADCSTLAGPTDPVGVGCGCDVWCGHGASGAHPEVMDDVRARAGRQLGQVA